MSASLWPHFGTEVFRYGFSSFPGLTRASRRALCQAEWVQSLVGMLGHPAQARCGAALPLTDKISEYTPHVWIPTHAGASAPPLIRRCGKNVAHSERFRWTSLPSLACPWRWRSLAAPHKGLNNRRTRCRRARLQRPQRLVTSAPLETATSSQTFPVYWLGRSND